MTSKLKQEIRKMPKKPPRAHVSESGKSYQIRTPIHPRVHPNKNHPKPMPNSHSKLRFLFGELFPQFPIFLTQIL